MAENSNSDLMSLFQEFLDERERNAKEAAASEDDEIEIWNADGSGARGRRSGFASWLEKNGFSTQPEPAGTEGAGNDPGKSNDPGSKSGRKSTGKTSNATGSASVARKYFGSKATP